MRIETTTWGQSLVLALFETPGGLNPVVKRIQDAVGQNIGTRTTFAKLQTVKSVSELDRKWQWRAWLLLTALGEEPLAWNIYDDAVPAVYADSIERLRNLVRPPGLEPGTHWLWVEPTPPAASKPRGRRPRNTAPRGRAN